MYKISVPVMISVLENYGSERIISHLKSLDAERVFLCPGDFIKNRDEEIAKLKKYTAIMKNSGFETGVWVWAFQYKNDGTYTYMTSPKGAVSQTTVCPSDKAYREFIGKFVEDTAECGTDIFMFDDDYRYGYHDIGFGCCCENHIKMISDIVGEDVDAKTLEKNIMYGAKNKYRDAFVKANGIALEEFSAEMRRHLDKVNPDIRMGFCSCITSWDIDGTTPDRLAKILAGKTKPFYRLIGAPYWSNGRSWGNRLADVIEFERLEASRRESEDIEIFAEGDTYPRPRYMVPAAALEGFDTALRVSGSTDGILKYALDYCSDPDYETGYVKAHIRNRGLYSQIDKMFGNKTNVGIRVWDKAAKFADMLVPERVQGKNEIQDFAFSAGARMLTACSLPAVYEGAGTAGIAFGEDVLSVPENMLSSGLIIDARAAEILNGKGIDTGINGFYETLKADCEIFADGRRVALPWDTFARKISVSEKAEIESRFSCGEETVVGSFRYENENGQRFLVLCYDAYFNGEALRRQYLRAEQLIEAVKWLSGKPLPCSCPGNPDLYIQAKQNEKEFAAAFWNFFPDIIENPVVTLGFEPKKLKTINCTAEIKGNKVYLSEIQPYAFAAFSAE